MRILENLDPKNIKKKREREAPIDNQNALKRMDIPKNIPMELYDKISTKRKCKVFLTFLVGETLKGKLSERLLSSVHSALRTFMELNGWMTKNTKKTITSKISKRAREATALKDAYKMLGYETHKMPPEVQTIVKAWYIEKLRKLKAEMKEREGSGG